MTGSTRVGDRVELVRVALGAPHREAEHSVAEVSTRSNIASIAELSADRCRLPR